MSHFNDIELHRWSASGPRGDRERVVAHIAECAECARRYAAAVRRGHLDRAEPVNDAAELTRFGRRAASIRRNRWRGLSLVAAAVLVVIVAVPLLVKRREPVRELNLRGANIQAVAPAGAVSRADVEFIWASGVAAARYRVVIGDSAQVLSALETSKPRLAAPAELRARLQPGVEYWWTVTALDSTGAGIVTSPRMTFTIREDLKARGSGAHPDPSP